MKIFVTGGTGFIGKHLLTRLQVTFPNENFIVLTRQKLTNHKNIEYVQGRLESSSSYKEYLSQCDKVIHLGAVSSAVDKFGVVSTNIEGSKKLIRLSEEFKIKLFVFISSTYVDIEDNLYGQSKRATERELEKSSLPYFIFRPGAVYGIGMREKSHLKIMRKIIRKFPLVCCINFWVDFPIVHVDDFCIAIESILKTNTVSKKPVVAITEIIRLGLIVKLLSGRKVNFQVNVPSLIVSLIHSFKRVLPENLKLIFINYKAYSAHSFLEFFKMSDYKKLQDHIDEI